MKFFCCLGRINKILQYLPLLSHDGQHIPQFESLQLEKDVVLLHFVFVSPSSFCVWCQWHWHFPRIMSVLSFFLEIFFVKTDTVVTDQNTPPRVSWHNNGQTKATRGWSCSCNFGSFGKTHDALFVICPGWSKIISTRDYCPWSQKTPHFTVVPMPSTALWTWCSSNFKTFCGIFLRDLKLIVLLQKKRLQRHIHDGPNGKPCPGPCTSFKSCLYQAELGPQLHPQQYEKLKKMVDVKKPPTAKELKYDLCICV